MKSSPTEQDWLHVLLRALKQRRARKELQRITDERRESFETERFRRRRAAALKATRGTS